MRFIYQGYEFSFSVRFSDGSDASILNARLYNSALDIYVETNKTINIEEGINFSLPASITVDMPEGVYSLEIYYEDEVYKYEEAFARVITSSMNGSASKIMDSDNNE